MDYYIEYPSKLTNEEETLLKKYAKLKRKKQALQARRAPKPEPPPPVEEKKTADAAADATLQAKKLLKLGAIKVTSEKKKEHVYKRAKRHRETDKGAGGYQPYKAPDTGEESVKSTEPASKITALSQGFILSKEAAEKNRDEVYKPATKPRKERRKYENLPTKGHTVYIQGQGLEKDELKKMASSYGNVRNIHMEPSCAFVTFEEMSSADMAIEKLNGNDVNGAMIKVSFARRQPEIPTENNESEKYWNNLVSTKPDDHKDDRLPVAYDDNLFE